MAIICTWTESDDIRVVGASSKEEAREAALLFWNDESGEYTAGLTLDNGFLSDWGYGDPQPEGWEDSYVFRVMDEAPLPVEYYQY